jgi:hypothetical protein
MIFVFLKSIATALIVYGGVSLFVSGWLMKPFSEISDPEDSYSEWRDTKANLKEAVGLVVAPVVFLVIFVSLLAICWMI